MKENIGTIIASRRAHLSLSQQDLADMANVTAKTIYGIEHNMGNPTLKTLEKILSVLGLELNVVIKNVEE